MAKSSYAGANVLINSDTFSSWITRTNEIIYDLSTIVVTTDASTNGAVTSGNASFTGILNSNTLAITTALRGGSVANSANLSITSNLNVTANLTVAGTVSGTVGNITTFNANTFTAANATIVAITSNTGIFGNSTVNGTQTINVASIVTAQINAFSSNTYVDYNVLAKPVFRSYGEATFTANASGNVSLDLSNHNVFLLTLTGNAVLTMVNPLSVGYLHSATIILVQDATGGRTVSIGGRNTANTAAATMRYPGAIVPLFSAGANAVDVVSYVTFDGGVNYHGALSLLNSQ